MIAFIELKKAINILSKFVWIALIKYYCLSIAEIYRLYKQILRVKDHEEFPMILIGNKCDLQRQRAVSNEMIEELKNQLHVPYMETSAKTRYNVEEAFYDLVRLVR